MSDETTAAMYDALRMYHEAKARAEKAERELVERTRERDAAREALRVFRAFIQRWYDVRFPGKAPNETLWVAFRQEALSLNENEKVRAARMGGG